MSSCDDGHVRCCIYDIASVAQLFHTKMSSACWETAVKACLGNERVEDLARSVILRLCVILGQPFPRNALPPAKEKSLQWYAHITLQKHQDDLKRPESEETETL